MKITNKHNLPSPFLEAVKNDSYDRGTSDYTTTELIKPPQILALEKRYGDELEEDVIDCLYRMQGQIMHVLLERGASGVKGLLPEKRYFYNIFGKRISGQMDLCIIKDKILYDYKYTTVWSWIFGPKKEYIEQANINRWLLFKNGIRIEKLTNILMFRDFQDSKKNTKNYPKEKIVKQELPVWSLLDTQLFIEARINLHEVSKKHPDSDLIECSPEERWVRNGKSIRCEKYCPVSQRCHQWKRISYDKKDN